MQSVQLYNDGRHLEYMSVLCTAPSDHALTHAYSQWIRGS